MGNVCLPVALGDSTIVRMCIYRTLLHSKMTARALVISVLEGEGEKDYGEGMEREKREAKEKEGRGREIELSVQLSV